MLTKSRNNKNNLRLLKQLITSDARCDVDFYEVPDIGVVRIKPIRAGSVYDQLYPMEYWDLPARSHIQRTWKEHRRTKYKV